MIALDADARRAASSGCGWRARARRSAGGARCRRARSWWRTPSGPVALVLGEVGEDAGVTPETERMMLCALRVKGVPRISVEEALWTAAETLYT